MKSTVLTVLLVCGLAWLNATAQDLYDIDNITVIELTFDDPNWDQTLDTYYAADNGDRLLATCTINGQLFDSVGVRYKGNATYSASNAKNPLNIKLDYTSNQDYDGFETLKLSSGNHDPSFVREVLSYEIARKYTVAPQSNYAKVYVNGTYHGLYSSSENIGGDFQARYLYADKDNPRFKCNNDVGGGPFGGGSVLEYLGTDSTLYYNYYELDSDYGWTGLAYLITTLEANPADIETVIDMDRAIWMMAFNNVLASFDSYIGRKQNYYLCMDDNGLFDPILWDMNESLGGFESTGSGGPGGGTDLSTVSPYVHEGDDSYPLLALIYNDPTYRRMYIAHCKTIVAENFSNGWYETRANELHTIISDAHQTDPNALYTWTTAQTNITSTISGGGGGPGGGGSQGAIGITELMDARATYLASHADFAATQPLIDLASTTPASIAANSTFDLVVDVSNANTVMLGYRDDVAAEFVKVEMLDDGQHNDGAAGDGRYGYTLAAGERSIQYYIYAENDDAGMFSPQRAQYEFHELAISGTAGDVVINEFMASNDATIADDAGEYDDWVELYNNTASSIDLSGYFLSDEADAPMKWEFPAGTSIDGNGFLIIWADNDDGQTGLHANFKLSSAGEGLYLSNANGDLVDYIYFGAQTTDVSTGRAPNGTGDFVTMSPTFNAVNENPVGLGEVAQQPVVPIKVMTWPNPATSQVTISWEHPEAQRVTIWGASGRTVYAGGQHFGNVQLNTTRWTSGLYFVRVNDTTTKLIVKH